MLKKHISLSVVFAIFFATVASPGMFAQTLAQLPPLIEPIPAAPTATPKSDLRTLLAAEMSKIKDGRMSDADIKRLDQQQSRNQQSHKSGWTRKNTIFMTLWVVVITGLVVVAIKHRCKAPKPCPEIDSTDYSGTY